MRANEGAGGAGDRGTIPQWRERKKDLNDDPAAPPCGFYIIAHKGFRTLMVITPLYTKVNPQVLAGYIPSRENRWNRVLVLNASFWLSLT